MDSATPLLTVNKVCDDAIPWATHKLEEAGYHTMQTFDLQVARQLHFDGLSTAHSNYSCPYHGAKKCECQMVVLLIYKGKRKPITMIVHGCDQASWFYLVKTPQHPVEHRLEKMIQEVLTWR